MPVELTVNGSELTLDDPERDLASALRAAGHTEVKCGCDGGDCGASTVMLDGETEMACGLSVGDAAGATVETVAALGTQSDLHPVQQSFVDHFAVQCGFCIPGMVVEATSLLDDNPDPTEREVREAIDDNVCRCTGYQKPVEAILDAADRLDGGDPAVATDGGTADGGTTDDRTADPANGGDADE